VVKVDGVIDRPVADYLIGALHDAEQTGSTVVIQLTTPGSIDIDPVALAERMFDATVPVVVWVGPAPAHAMGGGLLLGDASALAVVAPGAGTGPLEPLDLGHRSPPGGLVERAGRATRRWADRTGRPASFPPVEEPG